MILCFTGTHGSGKTTLAHALADKTGLPYFPSQSSKIHRRFGVEGGEKISFELRLRIQQEILASWSEDYATALISGMGIFDRCPVDFAAYLLADLQRDTVHSAVVEDYVWTCQSISARIKHLLLVKPLAIKLNDRGPEKGSDGAFATQVHMLVRGLVGELGRPYLAVESGSLDARLFAVSRYMSRVFEEAAVATTIEGSRYDGPEVSALH